MSNQADHTIVRLRVPPELKEKIEKSAEENNRSQSAEMVSRLEQSFKHQADLIAIAQSTSYSVRSGLEAMQAALDRIIKLQNELDEKSALLKDLTKNTEK